MEKKTYWILPMAIKDVTFNTPKGKTTVVSLTGAEFLLIKDKKSDSQKDDVVVETPYGKLIYRPKIGREDGVQITKTFNVTTSFCKKLYPKVVRKLWGESLPEIYDFKEIDQRRVFINKVLDSNVVLGIVGASGKKGFLKRVTPVAPLKELDKMENIFMESASVTYDRRANKLYSTFERLIEKMSLIKDEKKRSEMYHRLETLM